MAEACEVVVASARESARDDVRVAEVLAFTSKLERDENEQAGFEPSRHAPLRDEVTPIRRKIGKAKRKGPWRVTSDVDGEDRFYRESKL
jgi:hypothetical protein